MSRLMRASATPILCRHVTVELNEDDRRQLWIPRGFAHGFGVLSENADFFYKCDDLYSPKDELAGWLFELCARRLSRHRNSGDQWRIEQ
jgi:dTDP-4-dehydrorhamnose 3,5-epimerase-like enzyme